MMNTTCAMGSPADGEAEAPAEAEDRGGVRGFPPVQPDQVDANSPAGAPDAHLGDQLCSSAAGTCTLRAAIMEVNALAKTSSNVKIPAGTYTLTVQGAGEDQAATGDLDLRVTMNISAASGTPI